MPQVYVMGKEFVWHVKTTTAMDPVSPLEKGFQEPVSTTEQMSLIF